MTASTSTIVPSELIAGDTWSWIRTYDDYLAVSWSAKIIFQNSVDRFEFDATPSGNAHSFSIAASNSNKKAGRYKYFIRVTSGASVVTVEDGWVDIRPNPATTGAFDHRSHARKTLDAVIATLEGRATSDQSQMQINGRAITRISLPELRQWQTQLEQQVRTEEVGAKRGMGRNLKVRFGRA